MEWGEPKVASAKQVTGIVPQVRVLTCHIVNLNQDCTFMLAPAFSIHDQHQSNNWLDWLK